MRKSQILVLALAFGLVVGLYSMPKVLVRSQSANLTASTDSSTSPASAATDTHGATLTEAQQAQVSRWRNALNASANPEKKTTFADSLASLYQDAFAYDSAAAYRDMIATLQPSPEHWLQAGDGYYEAFSFATGGEKANTLGTKSREYYQKVLEQAPDRLDVKAKMAMTYVTTSNPMQGISMLREVIEKDPQNELALFNLGILSIRSGQHDKAIERFKQVLAVNPENVKAELYLGVSYAESGNRTEARKWLQQAKANDPDPMVQTTVDEYLKDLDKK